jgi:hypothetical protein
MEFVIPLLESKIRTLAVAFRFVVFAMLVAGLIVHMSRRQYHGSDLVRPLARAIVITAAIAAMSWWFPLAENTFLAAAGFINENYNENPGGVADTIREDFVQSQNPEGQEWSWRKLNESIYQTVTNAITWCFVKFSTLLTAPMVILQYILRQVLYLLTPFALACFMIPALAGLGIRFFQQLLAILAWPVGFAITNLVAIAIWQDFRGIIGGNPASLELAVVSPVITQSGIILACIFLVIGTVSTPLICQMFLAQGYAFTGVSGNPYAIGKTLSSFSQRQEPSGKSRASAAPVQPPPLPSRAAHGL